MKPRIGSLLLVAAATLCVGCSDWPLFDTVTVIISNDTDFDVDPHIVFDDDTGFFARNFPSEELSVGLLEPGESRVFHFDCDQLGVIFSDEAEQFVGDMVIEIDETSALEREKEFFCGDLIEFQFVGNLDDFGAIVTVNGLVVD
jgi:hypothetical protein